MCALLGVLLCGLTGEAFGQQRSDVVVGIDSQNYYLHTLAEGEGVAEVAGLYGLSASEICQANQIAQGEEVAEGRVLRVPCYERVSKLAPKRGDRRYERYAVAQGKSLFDVAVENAISLDTLVVDNPGVDITDISNCRTLNVRLSAKGLTQLAEIERASRRYAALLDGLSTEYEYFVVESGQTLYSLGVKHCKGVDVLAEENGYPEVIHAGQVLKCAHSEREPLEEVLAAEVEEFVAQADSVATEVIAEVALEQFSDEVLSVALMLPMTNNGKVRANFVEFYQGALLAAEDLKREGRSLDLKLYDVAHNPAQVEEIIAKDSLAGGVIDLFVGPVYEEDVAPLRSVNRPVVLPLTSKLDSVKGRHLYRLAPTSEGRRDKLSGMIAPTTNVIMVYTSSYDEQMEREMLDVVGDHPFGKVIFTETFEVDSLQSRPIEELMTTDDNLFVVLADNEIETDRSLAIISSIMNSRQPKYGTTRVPIRVVGNAAWERYRNMDKNLLFKLDVSYLINYHADRGNQAVREFDKRFIKAFGRQPSTFAYRAYDAVRLFATAMFAGGDLTAELNGSVTPLLQIPYSFTEEDGIMVNDSWALVNYRPNYTVEGR